MDERESTVEQQVTILRSERRGKERKDLSFQEIINLARNRGKKQKELWEGPDGNGRRRRG